jgi:two-component system alkaline phosphatase synthesis response regulator PhoP
MKPAKILVVEDEPSICQILCVYLENAGFVVAHVDNGAEALARFQAFRPDLVILDLNLPGMDGLEVAQQLRRESAVYILMLTARGEVEDRITGLRQGADDYVTKPFSPREVVARVETILRRRRQGSAEPAVLRIGPLTIDKGGFVAQIDAQKLELTTTEFELLWLLARNAGRVCSRAHLLAEVWGRDYVGNDRVVDVYVGQVRRKIAEHTQQPLIETVRGMGYKFVD